MLVKATIRAISSRFFALALLCCATSAWTPLAMAQHSSALCPVQSGNVANGGSTIIEVTDCVDFFGPGVGPVQGSPTNGTAVLSELFTPPATYQAFVTYTHNGNSATSDVFTFKDEYGQDVQVNITIAPAASTIVVSPASISLQTGVSVNTTLSSTGGTAPYTYTLNSGTVPAGLSLAGASLSGTPTQRGPFSFTVRSQDSLGDSVLKTYGGTIADPVLGIAPPATMLVNVPSTLQLAGTGGTPAYTFAYSSGTLPTGTSLQANGQLAGTPTAVGTFNFSVLVNDSTTDPSCPGCDFFAVVPVSVTVIAAPNLTINDVSLVEGNAGTTNAVFTVSLSAVAGAGGVTFDIGTAANTATANQDYTTTTLTSQTIPAGNSSYTFNVPVIGDLLHETDETYFVNVTNVTGAIVTDGQGAGTITNDDAVPTITITDTAQVEGNSGTSTAQFAVFLSAASGQTVTIGYATSDGSATAGSDYVSASGTLTFAPGVTSQSVDVTVNGDGTPESDETFDVTLSGPTNATIATGTAVGTITNDDTPLSITTATLADGTVGAAYSETLAATGGVAPYSYAVTTGTLPAGLTLSATGVLSGTPTAGGSFPITITVTDSTTVPGALTDDAAFTLVVDPATITLPATTLADGELGTAYSETITPATGGTAPYSYSVTAGALPAGLTLNAATGEISGTPTAFGTFNFTLTAADSSTGSGPYTGSQGYSLTIGDIAPVANPVSATVAHGSGANPVTLNITGGTPASVAIGTAPTNGTAIASGTSITYQPNAGYGGSDSFTYTATNSAGTSAPATVSVTVNPATITVSPAAVPNPQVGQPYSQTITASGGTAPYTYALSAGAFAPGLSLATDGTLSGTPTVAGSFSFIITATDSSTGSGPYSGSSNVYTVTVAAPTLTLGPAAGALPPGDIGAVYSQTFTAGGGIAPYSYSVTAGSLPAGLSIGAGTGVVSGTPTAAGTFNFTITASDSSAGAGAPFTVSNSYSLTIGAPTLSMTPAPGTLAMPYASASSHTFLASGGTGPYTYSLNAGALPVGVSMSSAGVLSGTPTVPGDYSISVRATDSSTGAGPFSIINNYIVSVPMPTITLAPPTLPDAAVGVAYSETITASGGAAGYTYSVLSGSLPVGMSFSSAGVFSGTPTTAGTYNFTIRATDANGQVGDQAYSVQVQLVTLAVAPPTLPNGTVGGAYSETVSASGGTAPYSFAVTAGTLPTGLGFAADGTLDGTATAAGTFNFTVTATDSLAQTGTRGYTVVVDPATIVVAAVVLPNGTVGATYNETVSASGGTAPYTYAVTAGALPTGLSLAADGTLTGTATAAGTFNFTVEATDAFAQTGDRAFSIVVDPATIVVDPGALANGMVGFAYAETLTASGGTAPYTFDISAGTLPDGLTLALNGDLTGTPTTAGTYTFTVEATDAFAQTGSLPYTVVVAEPIITLTPGTVPDAVVGTAYLQPIVASGGNGPYTFAISAGALPAGLTLAADGTLAGTPTVSGSFNFTIEATDAFAQTGDQAYAITVDMATITLTPAVLADGTVGTAYNEVFVASGGTAPYTFDLMAGTLPDGLTLAPNGDFTGIPEDDGTFTFTVRVTDAFAQFTSQSYALVIAPSVITVTPANVPDAVVGTAYSQPLVASGGTAPYNFFMGGGSLPFGLSLATDGTLAGTPSEAGTFNFTVRVVDAFSQFVDQPYTIIVDSPTITLTPATLPDGNVDTPYAQVIGATGGTPAYSFFVTAGTLPDGLLLTANGDLDGTPTTAGSYTFTIEASDQFAQTGSQTYTVVVGAPVITLNPATLPDSVVGAAYSQTIDATGGTAPFNFTVSGGALPPGIDLAADGTLSGTATNSGSFGFTINVVDGLGQTASRAYTLNVDPASITLTPATLPAGTVGTAYSEVFGATGGTAPYNFDVVGGALPDGLTLLLDGELSGTPTTAGSFTFTIEADDALSQTGYETYTLVVNAPTITLTPGTVPDAALGTAYSQAITASGGTGPYTFAISAGALPAGVTLAADGTLAGTPTASGSFNFTVEATDAFAQTGSQAYTLAVTTATLTLAPANLADGVAGTLYSQTVTASGGTGPYTFAITSGALPTGLSFSTGGGIDGTPSVAGSFTITVQATDSLGQTGSRSYTFAIAAPTLSLAPASLGNGTAGAAYTASFSTTGGTAPYTYAVTAGALPAGLTLSSGGNLGGTPTAEGSNSFTVTSTDALGFTASQAYTLVIGEAAPVAVADNAATLAGEAVVIAVSANDTGTATSIAVASAPANGTATVSGMDIEYTPAAGFSGTDTFTYTATGPGGTSAPATVTVTVNPLPFAPSFSATTAPATPVQVTVTAGATGGPFTGADVVGVSPAAAGTASIAASGGNFVLTFTPAPAYLGSVVVSYTLDNAFATSAEGVVSIMVLERPDPSQDAEVQGTIDAQSESTHRFATGQISNFQQRMERLHGGGDTGGVENGIGFSVDRPCIEPLVGRTVDPCAGQPNGVDGNGLAASGDARGARANNSHGPVGIWTGGMIRSGSDDGRDGNADISFETDGLSTGVDYRFNESLVVGGGFGYGRDDNEIGRNGSRVDGSARTIALYASYHPGEMFFIDSLVGYQQLDFDTRRFVTANGGMVNGQRDGDQWFASVSIGADIVRDRLLLTPYARFDFEQATLDSYTETGDPLYALHYDAMDVDNSSGSLGLRMDHQNDVSWGRFTPQVRIEYQHDFGGRSEALVRYADLFGGARYGLMATDFDRNRFLLGLGAVFDLDSGWGWRLEYVGQAGDGDGEDHGFGVQVQKQF